MNRKATERVYRARLLVVLIFLTGIAAGCNRRLYAPMQPDGWSAQPVVIVCRFASEYWSSARPRFWRWIYVSFPGQESGLMPPSGIWL